MSCKSTLRLPYHRASRLHHVTFHSNRLVNSCHAKCIDAKYHEPDLNKGEGVCIDRCTAKFFEVSQRLMRMLFLFLSFPCHPDPALRASWMPLSTRS